MWVLLQLGAQRAQLRQCVLAFDVLHQRAQRRQSPASGGGRRPGSAVAAAGAGRRRRRFPAGCAARSQQQAAAALWALAQWFGPLAAPGRQAVPAGCRCAPAPAHAGQQHRSAGRPGQSRLPAAWPVAPGPWRYGGAARFERMRQAPRGGQSCSGLRVLDGLGAGAEFRTNCASARRYKAGPPQGEQARPRAVSTPSRDGICAAERRCRCRLSAAACARCAGAIQRRSAAYSASGWMGLVR